ACRFSIAIGGSDSHIHGIEVREDVGLQNLYLGAMAFGVTLLVASFVLGDKEVGHGGDVGHGDVGDGDVGHGDLGHAGFGFAWAPFASLRFWVFFFTFGGGAGFALTKL